MNSMIVSETFGDHDLSDLHRVSRHSESEPKPFDRKVLPV